MAVIAGQRLEEVRETALVDLAGGRESITPNIGGRTEAGEVAFVMPVPARAAFELADGDVFAELDELSAPRIEYEDVVVGGADTFAEGLPSMRFTFATETPVYPMRLSATADYSQPLRLYVLADHRMDVSNPAPAYAPAELTYAGWVRPADLSDYPVLAERVDDRRFLTRYDATFRPDAITGDMTFTRAAADDAYRAVVVVPRYVEGSSGGLVVVLVGLGVLAPGAVGVCVRYVGGTGRP